MGKGKWIRVGGSGAAHPAIRRGYIEGLARANSAPIRFRQPHICFVADSHVAESKSRCGLQNATRGIHAPLLNLSQREYAFSDLDENLFRTQSEMHRFRSEKSDPTFPIDHQIGKGRHLRSEMRVDFIDRLFLTLSPVYRRHKIASRMTARLVINASAPYTTAAPDAPHEINSWEQAGQGSC